MQTLEPRSRKVKVLATVGPASRSPEMLAKLLRAGADAFRVNMSHGEHAVHAATIKAVEEITDFLEDAGQSVAMYHGRLSAKKRAEAQDRFMAGDVRALVATCAFGLGIDKPDIRFVAHYHLPGTMEAFYQEFGRAGRDGKPATGVLLYDPADQKLQRFFAGGPSPLPVRLSDEIVERAGGNPFFLEEIVRGLIEAGVLIADGTSEDIAAGQRVARALGLPRSSVAVARRNPKRPCSCVPAASVARNVNFRSSVAVAS